MKNLLYFLLTWNFLFMLNVSAQTKGSPPPCVEDCKIIKKCECDIFNQNYIGNKEHFIRFNQIGQLIGNMPSIIRKGDKLYFAIEGKNFTKSPLQNQIKTYEQQLKNKKYNDLSTESHLVFPDSSAFDEYKKNIGTYLPKIDTITINTIYQLTVQYRVKDECLKSDTLRFDITKLPCDSVAISNVFVVPCELAADQISFTLMRKNIDNILMANYLIENKDCYGQWGQYTPNFNKVKNDFTTKTKVIEDSLRAFDYGLLMGTVKDSLPSENLQKLLRDTNNLTAVNTYLEKALLNIPENKEWMKKWLWFTGLNAPSMNPFDKIKIDNNRILTVDKELAATQRRIDAIGLVIKNSQLSDNNDKIIKKYLNELDTLQQKVVELTDNTKALTNRKEAYEKWLLEREISSNLLYEGTLFVSEADQINWMPHYDALNNYRLSNAHNSIPNVVAGIDAVHPLVFNLRRGTKAFAEETVTPFTLTTPITDAFNTWGKLFDGILDIGKSLAIRGTEPILNLLPEKKRLQNQIEALNNTLPGFNPIELASPFEMQSFKSNIYQLEDKSRTRKKLSKSKILLDLKDRKENTYSTIKGFEMPDSEKNKTINWAKKFYELRDSLLPILENRKKYIDKLIIIRYKMNK